MATIYDTVTLLEVLSVQKAPKPFWLPQFFKSQINFETDLIMFDAVSTDYRRLAPFVAPNVQGKVMTTEGYSTKSIKAAYVKPKHVVDPDMAFTRRAGEAIGSGSLTPMQRRDAAVADILGRHRFMHTMTQEWMAASAVINGNVTIEGDGYPKVTVDFQRDATLTTVLTGGALWSAGTATPLVDIYAARKRVNTLCGGIVRDIIFGQEAWDAFSGNAAVQALLNNQVRGSDTNFTKLNDGFADSTEYLGVLVGVNGAGMVRMWLNTSQYIDEAGNTQFLLDQKSVVGVDPEKLEGFRCFGAIKDKSAGFIATDYFPKMWEEEDPSVEYVMTQSAPIMVPKQPNASFKIRVIA